jgi:hypothetical protein
LRISGEPREPMRKMDLADKGLAVEKSVITTI